MRSHTDLFLLPGLLEDAEAFHAVRLGVADIAHTRVADLTGADSIEALARAALEQAPERFHLAGHSMGGYVALEMQRQAPQRVEKLALLNTHARPDSPEATENRRRLMALAERDFPTVIATLLPKLMLPAHVADANLAGIVTTMALAVGREAFLRQERAIIGRVDSRPLLGAVSCPTLVVAARDDQLMPVEWLEELARGIPGAELEIVEECGHMAPIEKPREVIKLLREWITGTSEPGPSFPVEAAPPSS